MEFFEKLSDGYCLAQCAATNQLKPIKIPARQVFASVLNQKRPQMDFSKYFPQMQSFYVDKSKLTEDMILYDKLMETDGHFSKQSLDTLIKYYAENMFTDNKIYKSYRELACEKTPELDHDASNKINATYAKEVELHFEKLKVALNTSGNEESLVQIWKEAVFDTITVHHSYNDNDLRDLMIYSYIVLDLHPDFRDKLKKKNTLEHVMVDASNIWYGSQARYFITEDKAMRKKAEFIYKVFGCNVKMCNKSEFVRRISVV